MESIRGARQQRMSAGSWGLLLKIFAAILMILLVPVTLIARLAPQMKMEEAREPYQSDIILSVLKSDLVVKPKKIPSDLLELYHNIRRGTEHMQPQSCPPNLLLESYGPHVTCNLTVVRMDPRLESKPLFSLESVAFYNPDVCVALITTKCGSEQQVRDAIYSQSLPLFKRMIEQQRVRVAYMDRHEHEPSRYSDVLNTCGTYTNNPTCVLMHHRFWVDEFTPQDPDVVLVVQDDSVLCRPLEYDPAWSYAGGVWPPVKSSVFSAPWEDGGMCGNIQHRIDNMRPALKEQWPRLNMTGPIPSQLYRYVVDVLQNCTQGVVGNGGFSLRSRAWMTRTIQLCPHETRWSGIADRKCDGANGMGSEDLFFTALLYAVEAPLPTAFQAAEFAVESMFLEDLLSGRFDLETRFSEDDNRYAMATSGGSWHKRNRLKVRYRGKSLTIPVGFHKPWLYMPKSLLLSPEMEEACPFLHFVFEPHECKHQD